MQEIARGLLNMVDSGDAILFYGWFTPFLMRSFSRRVKQQGQKARSQGEVSAFCDGRFLEVTGQRGSQLIGVPHSRHLSVSIPCSRPQCEHTVPLSGSRRLSVLAKIHSDLSSISYSARQSRHFILPDLFRRLSLAQNGHLLCGIMRSVCI